MSKEWCVGRWWLGGLQFSVKVCVLHVSKKDNLALMVWEPPEKAAMQHGRQLQEKELEKELNSEKERKVYLKHKHLEQVAHCTDLPLRATFRHHTKQEKIGPEFGRTLPLI